MVTVLKLLQDGNFHSGQALGSTLGISRSAVWKQLQQLQSELHLSIHSVRGRGYRLESPLSLLREDLFASGDIPWPLDLQQQLDSTNAESLRALQAGRPAPFLILAEQQLSGRGRRGRRWVSPFAENLYFSLAWRIEGGARRLDGLSLVVGLAVLQTLRAFGVLEAGLKWPNDLLVRGKKIAGILLELAGDPADVCHVIIGIGINVNMRVSADEIEQPWTSIRLESGGLIDRNCLVQELTAQLELYLDRHAQVGFAALREEWEAAHLWQGCEVALNTATSSIFGRVTGVDDTGALRLDVGGVERVFSGGEVSLRLHNDS